MAGGAPHAVLGQPPPALRCVMDAAQPGVPLALADAAAADTYRAAQQKVWHAYRRDLAALYARRGSDPRCDLEYITQDGVTERAHQGTFRGAAATLTSSTRRCSCTRTAAPVAAASAAPRRSSLDAPLAAKRTPPGPIPALGRTAPQRAPHPVHWRTSRGGRKADRSCAGASRSVLRGRRPGGALCRYASRHGTAGEPLPGNHTWRAKRKYGAPC